MAQVGGTAIKGNLNRRADITNWRLKSCNGPGPSGRRADKALKTKGKRTMDKMLRSDWDY